MEPLLYQWHADPLVLLMVMTLIYFHYRVSGPAPIKNRIYFWSGIGLIGITTCSPLHFLGMHVYFSAHMITHVVLLLIAGPLLVMSIGPNSTSPILKRMSIFLHKRSWLAWLSAVGIMWCWHIPSVFVASFAGMSGFTIMPLLHAGTMLLAGMLFCWPLVGPFPETHIHPLSGVIYLSTACISCSLLGLLITFAPANTFHHYGMAGPSMKSMPLNPWGLSQASDQQTAGLIMWVPCCFVYLSGCLYLLQRWFAAKDPDTGHEASISLTLSKTKHE
jgi:cytochrome c oxidase assembly factor CtaG